MTCNWKRVLVGLATTAALTTASTGGLAAPAAADGPPRFFAGHATAQWPSVALILATNQAQGFADAAGATGCEPYEEDVFFEPRPRIWDATVVIMCLW